MSHHKRFDRYKLSLAFILSPSFLLAGYQLQASAANWYDKESEVEIDRRSKLAINSTLNLAQLPNPITPEPPQPTIPDTQPTPKPPIELNPSPTQPSSPQLPKIPGTIIVTKFEFTGNTAFSDAELRETVKEFINKPISFTELLQAEEKVKQKYTAGCNDNSDRPCYINSGAFIPANQTFSANGAVVTIQVVEGSIEDIEITGLKKLHPNYIRSRLQGGIDKPLEQEQLLEKLQILQLDPLIQNISAELAAGSRPESSILELTVTEADPFFIELFTDNSRAPSVGSWRRGIRINESNLLGFGDRIFGEYVNTDGSNAIDLSYSLPLTASNTTVNIRGGVTSTKVTEEPFDRLDIQGDSFNFEFGLRQPVLRTPTKEVALSFSGTRQESNTEVLRQNFALAPGADDNGETRISALRFSQEYTQRTLEDVFAVRSQFNIGLDIFNSTTNDEPLPDSRFFAWRGQGQYVRRLGQNSLVVLRSDLQLATTNLVPLEQFSTGGLQSVRGYRQDALLTDNGFFTSAEVRLPIVKVNKIQGLLSLAPFVDLGVGWNSGEEEDPQQKLLVGLGMGLQWQMGDKFNARIDYGIPLTDVENSDRTLQEDGIYFSVNYSPF
jgi:hemolysin activation/secretion protein